MKNRKISKSKIDIIIKRIYHASYSKSMIYPLFIINYYIELLVYGANLFVRLFIFITEHIAMQIMQSIRI
jgi:hypothetical protein